MCNVENSIVVAWEVVFLRNRAFAGGEVHMHKRTVCIKKQLNYTVGQTPSSLYEVSLQCTERCVKVDLVSNPQLL